MIKKMKETYELVKGVATTRKDVDFPTNEIVRIDKKFDGLAMQYVESEQSVDIKSTVMQNNLLKKRNQELMASNRAYKGKMEKVLNMAHQLLERSFYTNHDLAKEVVNEFEVNPERPEYRENYEDVVIVMEALRKMDYYDRSTQEDVYQLYREKKRAADSLEFQVNRQSKEIAAFHEKLLEKEREADGLRQQLVQLQMEIQFTKNNRSRKGTTPPQTSKKPVIVPQPAAERVPVSTKEIRQQTASAERLKRVIISKDGSVLVTHDRVTPQTRASIDLAQQRFFPKQEEGNSEFPGGKLEEVEDVSPKPPVVPLSEVRMKIEENPSDRKKVLRKQAESPLYLTYLASHEKVEIDRDPTSRFDAWIMKEKEKIPLCYIDYEVEDGAVFEKMMEHTKKVYFVFDTRQHYNKGNMKFTTWLFKSGRSDHIEFSFTTEDDLKQRGLSALDKL